MGKETKKTAPPPKTGAGEELKLTENHRRALAVAVADFSWLHALPRTLEDAACHVAYLCSAHGREVPEDEAMASRARRVLEVVAAHRSIERPEDLSLETLTYELTSNLAPELDRRRQLALALADRCGFRIESWDPRDLWEELDLPAFEEGYTEQNVNAYRWHPVWDPEAPFFDGRIEIQPIYVDSIAEHGVMAPIHVFRRSDDPSLRAFDEPTVEDIVVIDGIQRLTSALEHNRRLLLNWSSAGFTGRVPDFVVMVPARYFEGKSEKRWRAFMALNEQRLEPDPITRAQKIDLAVREAGLHILDVAAAMKKEERMIRHYVALLKLSPQMQRKVQRGDVSFPLARVLCQIEDHELQAKAWFSIRCLSGGKASKWLYEAITVDHLKAAIAEGATIVENEAAKTGNITRCPETGKMFLVTDESPRHGGQVFSSAEAVPAPNAPAKHYNQRLAQLEQRIAKANAHASARDVDLLRAAISFIKDGKVDPQFAWFAGSIQSTRRRKADGASELTRGVAALAEGDA